MLWIYRCNSYVFYCYVLCDKSPIAEMSLKTQGVIRGGGETFCTAGKLNSFRKSMKLTRFTCLLPSSNELAVKTCWPAWKMFRPPELLGQSSFQTCWCAFMLGNGFQVSSFHESYLCRAGGAIVIYFSVSLPSYSLMAIKLKGSPSWILMAFFLWSVLHIAIKIIFVILK